MLNTQYFISNSDEGLFERILLETKKIGYYSLPEQNLDYLHEYLEKLDTTFELESITDVVVVGIGGSSLGAKAVYNFLKPLNNLAGDCIFSIVPTLSPLTVVVKNSS
jgi:glucose-6-phosphate isomerase